MPGSLRGLALKFSDRNFGKVFNKICFFVIFLLLHLSRLVAAFIRLCESLKAQTVGFVLDPGVRAPFRVCIKRLLLRVLTLPPARRGAFPSSYSLAILDCTYHSTLKRRGLAQESCLVPADRVRERNPVL